MLYYTLHMNMDAHHYVRVDVVSYFSCYLKPYYILHRYMGTHHYVCVDVLSDSSFY